MSIFVIITYHWLLPLIISYYYLLLIGQILRGSERPEVTEMSILVIIAYHWLLPPIIYYYLLLFIISCYY